jgi:hypothetical protein
MAACLQLKGNSSAAIGPILRLLRRGAVPKFMKEDLSLSKYEPYYESRTANRHRNSEAV